MLDPNLLRKQLDVVAKKLALRKFKLNIFLLRYQEKNRKILQIKAENLQAECNYRSKKIGIAKLRGENIDLMCKEVHKLGERLKNIKIKLEELQKNIYKYTLTIPNITAEEVPIGINEKDNTEISRWGEPRHYNFPILDHIELGKMLVGLDFTSSVKLTGTRFVVMRGQIAHLNRALIQFMLDLHIEKHGYQEYYLPYMVNYTSLYGAGQLPRFSEDLFYIQSFDKNKKEKINTYAMIPTAEVPLINLKRDEIIKENELPLKMIAYTPCFRSEAGSYGCDTRGLIRMHQFDKIEMVQIVKPELSMLALEEITGHAEKVLQLLNLPYRKIILCTGDTGFAACKTFDLEVWLPSQNVYREISSCSNTSDFQSRRLKIRYRTKTNKKPKLVHILNGSGLAVSRTLAAVLENYQLADGRIEIPQILKPYMKGLDYIG